jgi:histidyl-tRNA synthetase
VSEGTKREKDERPAKEPRRQFRAIKGTRDILPPDSALWNWFEKTARGVMESYNFAEIRTPIFEETELFARSIGADTDVVSKEMFSFQDYEYSELFEYRTAVMTWLEQPIDAAKPGPLGTGARALFAPFVTVISRFNSLARQGLDRGEVPKTPENEKLQRHLEGEIGIFSSSIDSLRIDDNREAVRALKERVREFKFGDDLTLRPEATASVCRAYIEHGMQTRPGDQKLYYVGPMFRRERPQKGRYRQFYQIGAEVLGTSDAPAIDAELIEMLTVLIARCKIEKWTLLINSIGCANTKEACRPKYVELLRAELRKPEIFSKLGPDSQRRVETNPLRVMDSKLPEEQPIIEKLPKISEHLCAECREHYENVKKELRLRLPRQAGKEPFTESPRLVRGLDYYMRTTFEITSPVLGAQNALCGGGRYDGLVEMLGGPKGIKGIGFALGEDRFIDAIVEAKKIDATRAVDVFIAWMGEKAYPEAVRLARVLRDAGRAVEMPAKEMKFGKAFERADKIGARYVLILGDNEIVANQVTVKRLADGEQKTMSEGALLDYLR